MELGPKVEACGISQRPTLDREAPELNIQFRGLSLSFSQSVGLLCHGIATM